MSPTIEALLDQPIERRKFFVQSAACLLGVHMIPWLEPALQAADPPTGKSRQLLLLTMRGAMSHLDTFDPKPGREVQGTTEAIQTKIAGVKFGQALPKLAAMADRLAVIRSMSTETGDHEQGTYLMRTGYKKINSIQHPGLAAWTTMTLGPMSKTLPPSVLVGNGNEHPNAGFLDPKYLPVPVADASRGLENIKSPAYLSEDNFKRRLLLARKFDVNFQNKFEGAELEAYNELYRQAVKFMGSKDLEAFDIKKEPENVLAAYGANRFGQGCLLARRLLQEGVRCVEVEFDGWDMHQQIFTEMPVKGGQLDQAFSQLLEDLKSTGLLSNTVVALQTEFGRTPKINENTGRDHHPGAFSFVLAGAGIKPGVVHGSTDDDGLTVASDHVSIADFNTTLAKALGIDTDKEHVSPNGRPFKIGGGGTAISAVLA
jgi:uncharacterized protein (DUF1501 family)